MPYRYDGRARMASPNSPVVLYSYDLSPVTAKVKNILALKGIPYSVVDISVLPPRFELLELLGIAYRRVPVLAIGNDVYCDSSLIASVLERRYPPSEGYPTLFPKCRGSGRAEAGMVKALAMFYADRILYKLGAFSFPYDNLSEEFVRDRNQHFDPDGRLNLLDMVPRRKEFESTISSHLELLEEQLADDREWLMNTETPGLADVSLHFVYHWIQVSRFEGFEDLFDEAVFPKTISWLDRMSSYVQPSRLAALGKHISGAEAAELITTSANEDLNIVGYNSIEAARLGVGVGEQVSIEPEDTGKVPTVGVLLALNREEVVIQTHGSAAHAVHCHFPRLAFTICRYKPSDGRG